MEVSEDENGGLETTVSLEEVKFQCARLIAAGFKPKRVAQAMAAYLSPTGNVRSAEHKLRRWLQRDTAFRDLIYSEAVVKLDLDSPRILRGISDAAARGRVDAARLALEITGRHTSHEAPITQVAVVLNNIPRPASAA